MKAETDIKMTTAQYQALKPKYYATMRLKTGTQQSRVYQKHDGKIDNTTSAYSVLAKGEYIKGQERVRAQLPLNMSNEIGVKDEEELGMSMYQSQEKPVVTLR